MRCCCGVEFDGEKNIEAWNEHLEAITHGEKYPFLETLMKAGHPGTGPT